MAAFGRSNSWNQGLVGGMAIVQRRMASVVPECDTMAMASPVCGPTMLVAARGDALGEGAQGFAAGHAGVLRSPGPVAGLHLPLRIPAGELELEQAIVELHVEARHAGERLRRFTSPAHRTRIDGGKRHVRERHGDGFGLPPPKGGERCVVAVRTVVGTRLSMAHQVEADGVGHREATLTTPAASSPPSSLRR